MSNADLKASILAKAQATKNPEAKKATPVPVVEAAPVQTTQVVKAAPALIPAPIEEEYQVYKSTIDNQKIVMQNGRVLRITGGKFITKDPDEIIFLNHEISQGFPYLHKGEVILTSDLDPMSALRKKFYAEFLVAQAAGQLAAPAPVLGDSAKQELTPANSSLVAALSAGSTSVAE